MRNETDVPGADLSNIEEAEEEQAREQAQREPLRERPQPAPIQSTVMVSP